MQPTQRFLADFLELVFSFFLPDTDAGSPLAAERGW